MNDTELHISQDVYGYNQKKLCNLYDSSLNSKGQAYDIVYTNEINGWKTLSFHIPFVIDKKRNFRWNFIRNEYLQRMKINDKADWFIIHSPKKQKNRKTISNAVTCSHLSSILKTKNLYMTFDDENGIGTLPYLMEQVLKATGWTLGSCDKLYERDGKTEKVRSLKSDGKAGAYQLITDICNLFNAYPVFDGNAKTVSIYALNNKGRLYEMTMGKDIESLTVTYNSDDIITRLYVEGEYSDDGYVGIDDVNPTGLTYLMNFDYYKEIGLFTDDHQEALDLYYSEMKKAIDVIRSVAGDINTKENNLNKLWGQINYVFYPVSNGAITKKIIGGTVTAEQLEITEGNEIVIIPSDKKYRTVTAGANGSLSLTTDDLYAIKFISKPSAEIGAKEVAIEAKEKLIENLKNRITDSTSDEKKADINKQIASYESEINDLYVGTELETGLYDQMTSAAELVLELNALSSQREAALTSQENVEVNFAISMGDLLKDGYWNNSNYTVGQEMFLYEDAVEVINQMSKPDVSYSVSRVSLSGVLGHSVTDLDQNSKIRVYDPDLGMNDFAYISGITAYLDKPENDTVDISNEDLTLTGLTLDSILSRITKLADLIDQKNSLYDRSEAISKDGSIFIDRLEGQINVQKNQLSSSTSNWYTDQNGNLVFESASGKSAMMLCGEGFMIAYGRTANGDWNWRTFGTGEGFTADAIITGYLSADRIEARSITVNHLASDVGESLDLSSNESIKMIVENTVIDTIGVNMELFLYEGTSLTQVYNADTGVYIPDYTVNNGTIVPEVFVNDKKVFNFNSKLTITWSYLQDNEWVAVKNNSNPFKIVNGSLYIVKNTLSDITQLECNVVYRDGDITASRVAYITFTRSIVYNGDPGENAVLLTLYTPSGSVFSNGTGTLTIAAAAYDGTTDITSAASYAWQKYQNGSWSTVSGTSSSLSVSGASVSGIGIYRCQMTYKGKTYTAIETLTDKTDNYQADITSTGGDVFVNGVGSSTLSCRLQQNGKIVDAAGTAYTYSWSRLDADGNSVDSGTFATGKTIQVDGDDVSETTTFVCEVSVGVMAQFTISSRNDVVTGDSAPSNPIVDMLWLDTSDEYKNVLKRWNGADWIETTITQEEISNLYTTLSEYNSEIEQLSQSITLRVTQEQLNDGLANKADSDWVTQRLEAIIKQTAEDITFQFNQAKEFTVESTSEFQDFITEVQSYQRFSGDGLELGILNSPFIAKLGNTKLSFLQDGVEIAYISNNKLYITEAQVTDKLSIGTEKNGFFEWITTDVGLGMKWKAGTQEE